jgi:hypothetical protein
MLAGFVLGAGAGCAGNGAAIGADVVAGDPGDAVDGSESGDPGDLPGADVPDVGGVPDAVLDADAGAEADACVPDCAGRECGDDGCGGSCGFCDLLGPECTSEGHCGIEKCDWYLDRPTTWGPAAVVTEMALVSDGEAVKPNCFDYTGDGLGDNGAKGFAGQFNGPMADALAAGEFALLIELVGVKDVANAASFQLNGLVGTSTATPPTISGDFLLQGASFITDICQPMIDFAGARIAAGTLSAGPDEFQLAIPIQEGLVIDLTLIQTKLRGTIPAGGSADGFTVENGVLSGVITKSQLSTAADKMKEFCQAAPAEPRPEWCTYLDISPMAYTFFDLHDNGDGTFSAKSKDLPGDAMSICMSFKAQPARIVGYEPFPR